MKINNKILFFITLFILMALTFILVIQLIPVDRGVPAISYTHFKVEYQHLDNNGCLISYIIYNPYNFSKKSPMLGEIPEEILNNTEIIIVDYRLLPTTVKEYAPKNYKFSKVNWNKDMINLSNGIIEVIDIPLEPKAYTIFPMYCLFKNPPVYPYGKLIKANISKIGNNTYELEYNVEPNWTLNYVIILVPQKVGYDEEYKMAVIEYKNNISKEIEKIKEKYGLFIFENETDELFNVLSKYYDVKHPENYTIEQKANGNLIISKDFLGYYPEYYGYYTNGKYYEIVLKKTSGKLIFYSTGKPIVIINIKLSKHYVNKLYFENKITEVNQEIVISYENLNIVLVF
ncbi:conserved protein of unknown function [Methanocaldococcus lauensis]|uniref:Uncharacterized protein n=1 Tax=Methanocaldococcus lauensis TaxID=2546128 RepID=A0A8D6PTA5_9EURY|nr:hypothetical protein [Methanocaldococcus lauensis]CAB3289851.1 conserved protein of unknown function [Methanocaldococcus lauensis]